MAHQISDDFTLEGIALGTIVLLGGYHLLRWLAPAYMQDSLDTPAPFDDGTALAVGHTGVHQATLGEVGFEQDAAGTTVPPKPRRDGDDRDDQLAPAGGVRPSTTRPSDGRRGPRRSPRAEVREDP